MAHPLFKVLPKTRVGAFFHRHLWHGRPFAMRTSYEPKKINRNGCNCWSKSCPTKCCKPWQSRGFFFFPKRPRRAPSSSPNHEVRSWTNGFYPTRKTSFGKKSWWKKEKTMKPLSTSLECVRILFKNQFFHLARYQTSEFSPFLPELCSRKKWEWKLPWGNNIWFCGKSFTKPNKNNLKPSVRHEIRRFADGTLAAFIELQYHQNTQIQAQFKFNLFS